LIPTRNCPTDVAIAVLGMHVVGRYSSRKATRSPDDDIEFSVFSGSVGQNRSLSAQISITSASATPIGLKESMHLINV
jgi:hypothetical protein